MRKNNEISITHLYNRKKTDVPGFCVGFTIINLSEMYNFQYQKMLTNSIFCPKSDNSHLQINIFVKSMKIKVELPRAIFNEQLIFHEISKISR